MSSIASLTLPTSHQSLARAHSTKHVERRDAGCLPRQPLPNPTDFEHAVQPQPLCLRTRQPPRPRADLGEGRREPRRSQPELARDGDLVEGVGGLGLELLDGEVAQAGDAPSRGEAEDGGPFGDCADVAFAKVSVGGWG